MTANTALFFADYSEQQITLQQGADTDADGINDTFQSIVLNAGKSEYLGVEAEGSVFLTDALTLNYALGWIDADITEVLLDDPLNPGQLINQAENFVVQNTPEWTGSLGLTYLRQPSPAWRRFGPVWSSQLS